MDLNQYDCQHFNETSDQESQPSNTFPEQGYRTMLVAI